MSGVLIRSSRSVLAAATVLISAVALAGEFPFERELLLDVKPLPGSKRVPMLEVLANGQAVIDLWCKSGEGRAEVTDETIRFTLGQMREENCTPDRLRRDEELAAALQQVTQWRIEEDILVLIGPTELRYRHSTH